MRDMETILHNLYHLYHWHAMTRSRYFWPFTFVIILILLMDTTLINSLPKHEIRLFLGVHM